jgi:hypothetical protein
MKSEAENRPETDSQPEAGISNHDPGEENARQSKVLPFREKQDKRDVDRKNQ